MATRVFSVGEVVWAKHRRWPFWPSIVIRFEDVPQATRSKLEKGRRPDLTLVEFFHTWDCAWIKTESISLFDAAEAPDGRTSWTQPAILQAIDEAKLELAHQEDAGEAVSSYSQVNPTRSAAGDGAANRSMTHGGSEGGSAESGGAESGGAEGGGAAAKVLRPMNSFTLKPQMLDKLKALRKYYMGWTVGPLIIAGETVVDERGAVITQHFPPPIKKYARTNAAIAALKGKDKQISEYLLLQRLQYFEKHGAPLGEPVPSVDHILGRDDDVVAVDLGVIELISDDEADECSLDIVDIDAHVMSEWDVLCGRVKQEPGHAGQIKKEPVDPRNCVSPVVHDDSDGSDSMQIDDQESETGGSEPMAVQIDEDRSPHAVSEYVAEVQVGSGTVTSRDGLIDANDADDWRNGPMIDLTMVGLPDSTDSLAKPEGEDEICLPGWTSHMSQTFSQRYWWCAATNEKCWSAEECQEKDRQQQTASKPVDEKTAGSSVKADEVSVKALDDHHAAAESSAAATRPKWEAGSLEVDQAKVFAKVCPMSAQTHQRDNATSYRRGDARWGDGAMNGRRFYFGGVSNQTKADIERYFSTYVVSELLVFEEKGFGFVTFASVEDGRRALTEYESRRRTAAIGVPATFKPAFNRNESLADKQRARIFVGGLHRETTKVCLENYFEQFGAIEDLDLPPTKATRGLSEQSSRGIAFVTFVDQRSAAMAAGQDSHRIDGQVVEVSLCI